MVYIADRKQMKNAMECFHVNLPTQFQSEIFIHYNPDMRAYNTNTHAHTHTHTCTHTVTHAQILCIKTHTHTHTQQIIVNFSQN
jgi:hypothetical protein